MQQIRFVGLLALLAGTAAPAAAANYFVTTTNDSGPGSLREAITLANASPGFDQIRMSHVVADPVFRPLTPLPALGDDTYLLGWRNGNWPTDLSVDRGSFIDGSLMTGPAPVGLRTAGVNNQIIGFAIGNFSDGQGGGIGVLVEGSQNTVWLNFVGTERTGGSAQPNDTGIVVRGSDNTIGDDDEGWFSIVSGNGVGIAVRSGSGNVIRNTWIGTARAGTPLPNTSHGIRIVDGVATRMGTPSDVPPNRIAFNGGAAVAVEGSLARSNDIGNAVVFGNAGLAFDLGGDGPTPNDPGDGDAGPHDLQNFPVISSALFVGSHTEIRGSLDSRPNQTYRLQFHAAASVDATGRGQRDRFMGSMTVTTDASGHAPFAFDTFAVNAHFPFVSASADAADNLSEMSPAVLVSGALPASATFVVNVADTANLGRCSPARCSLAEAVVAANEAPNGPVPDAVHFAIPGAGPHVTDGWHYFTEAVVIDGFTQPGSSPNTIPFGAGGLNTVLKVEICGLTIVRDSTVRGLAMKDCGLHLRDGSVAEGNFIGTDVTGTVKGDAFGLYTASNNRIGGTSPAQRNLIVGETTALSIVGSSNLVQGNLIGTNAAGTSPLGAFLQGISLSSASGGIVTGNVIGGAGAAGNVISGHSSPSSANTFGILMRAGTFGPALTGNTIRGNYIGLTADGTAALPNKTGIGVTGQFTTGNLIEGNVISGSSSYGSGIYLFGSSVGTTVRGNWIGTGPGGIGNFPNADAGVAVFDGSHSNSITGNTIRGNGGSGIAIEGDTAGNRVSANAISGNGALGIDLGSDGVTPNDPGDADDGPNHLQNFPVVTAAATDGTVSATFQGVPSTTLLFEFFAGPVLDPTGHGEGARFLGWHLVATNAAGAAAVTVTLPNAILPDEWVTATATVSADGNTSEFGPGVRATNVSFPAVGLAVDTAGNGVAEPNETVVVAPSWTNATSAPITASGAASAFGGPAGASYVLSDAGASYGTIPAGGTASCAATGDCYAMGVSFTSRPAVHLDATFHEDVGPGNATWALHVGESFADVPVANPFYRFVETLLHRGVTGGCAGGAYCPASSSTREQMAVFVLVAREGAGYAPPACGAVPVFADVTSASPFCPWVEELARRGVVSGCGSGNYCPASPVSREQMAVFVLRTLDGAFSPPACAPPGMFTDVPSTSGFCRWIEELARRGVVTGCGGGNYCPADSVTREQMAVFITVTFGLSLYGP